MISKFLLFTAIFLFASCVSIERNNPDDPGSGNYMEGVLSGKDKGNDIDNYRIKSIGTQVWMAENLDYNVGNSICNNYNDANCKIYGRLYDWATAMGLSPDCNFTSCASQIDANHRGICPKDWHIPSDADWNVLMKFVNSGCSDNSDCDDAGRHLKANSGWGGDYYNGLDTYGFAALPGGSDFNNVGGSGYWWSSSEYDANDAFYREMSFISDDVGYYHDCYPINSPNISNSKKCLFSVRCVQD